MLPAAWSRARVTVVDECCGGKGGRCAPDCNCVCVTCLAACLPESDANPENAPQPDPTTALRERLAQRNAALDALERKLETPEERELRLSAESAQSEADALRERLATAERERDEARRVLRLIERECAATSQRGAIAMRASLIDIQGVASAALGDAGGELTSK